jgi:hypothetical protein
MEERREAGRCYSSSIGPKTLGGYWPAEDSVVNQNFKNYTIRRLVRQAVSSDIEQEWSHKVYV